MRTGTITFGRKISRTMQPSGVAVSTQRLVVQSEFMSRMESWCFADPEPLTLMKLQLQNKFHSNLLFQVLRLRIRKRNPVVK